MCIRDSAGGVCGHLLEGPTHVGQQVLADDLAVDLGGQRQTQESVAVAVGLQLVRGDEVGAEGGGGVLALAGAETDLHLAGLEVAGGPVVVDGVADDVVAGLLGGEVTALAADDGRYFEFEVQCLAAGWHRDVVVSADDRVGVGEVEGGRVVPGVRGARDSVDDASYALDVLLERDEVAYGRRLERRQQSHLGDVRAARHVHTCVARLAQCLGAGLDQVEKRPRAGAGGEGAVVLDGGETSAAVLFVRGETHGIPRELDGLTQAGGAAACHGGGSAPSPRDQGVRPAERRRRRGRRR